MTDAKLNIAIEKAQLYINQMTDLMHDISHFERVYVYAQEIAKSEKEVDYDVLTLAVWWHDVGRLYIAKGHPQKSSEMARQDLTELGFEVNFIDKVCEVIETHSGSTIPTTIEGKILKDADKLDFLTPARWEFAIKNKQTAGIEAGIKKIPIIRDEILSLNKSKTIFDELFKDLKNYAATVDDDFFKDYKKIVLTF